MAGMHEPAAEMELRVRHTLAEHRRREAELTALFDIASDLAKLRDPDAVLRLIVHRARTLLGADVSYLSLNEPSVNRTTMRVTDGSASALFQQVVLGMGEGLGGLVAQTARPYATEDYFADDRFEHTKPIDDAVLDEGLVAILGVPLALGDRVIGVLYASDRSTRVFTADEVALLRSLADHAAIAIDNADRIAALNEANKTISAQTDALRRAEDAHDRLMDLVLRGEDAQEVVAALGQVLEGGVTLHDADGVELARFGAGSPPPSTASLTGGRSVSTPDGWVCGVQAGRELLGSLSLTGRPDLAGADRRLFERAAVVAALLLLLHRSVAQAEDEVRGELLTDLLADPERNPSALLARARRIGVDLSAPHAVLVLHAEGVSRRRLAMTASRYASLVGVHAEQVVVLAPERDPGELAARVARELTALVEVPVTVGGAGPATGPVALAAAHAEAVRCVHSLLTLGRAGDGGTVAALGFVGLLLGERADPEQYIRSVLGPVLDYDARRGTELVHTLRCYFDAGTNLTRAKQALHVHVNTVVQRLERVTALLGDGWQEPDRALEVQLALRLHLLRAG
ncbi:helix-turn-helix domain-containing protein [Labedaea rhizosphaerae]